MVPKRPEVVSAALHLAESSNPEDQIFVVHFYEKIAFGLESGEAFTNNIEELRTAVSRIRGTGRTALYDAVIAGLEHVQQSKLTKRVLVIISDGGDNASTHKLKETLEKTTESNTIIYSIGIYNESDRDQIPRCLGSLQILRGERRIFPRCIAAVGNLQAHCNRHSIAIYAGLCPQQSTERRKLSKDSVSLEAHNLSQATVRTRSGYLVPRDGPVLRKGVLDEKNGEKARAKTN